MHTYNIASILSIFIYIAVANAAATQDYCFLGDGSSISYAAVMALDAGKTVAIIGTGSNLGGHCDTIRSAGGAYNEAGVGVFPDTAIANSLGYGPFAIDSKAYVQRWVGVNGTTSPFYDDMTRYMIYVNGNLSLGQVPNTTPTPAFLTQLQRYHDLMNSTYRWMDTMTNPPAVMPAGLNASLYDWVIANGFQDIFGIFAGPIFYGGMGDFHQVTALDALLQRTTTNLMYDNVPGSWFSVRGGCQTMYDAIQSYIGADSLYLNSTVDYIKRPNGNSGITRIKGKSAIRGKFNLKCKNIVIGVPQTLDNLEVLELTSAEYNLFSSVSGKSLFTGIYTATGDITNQSHVTWVNVDITDAFGLPSLPDILLGFRKFATGPFVIQAYSPEVGVNTSLMQTLVERRLQHLVASGFYTSVSNVRVWPHANYAPHWSPAKLGTGEFPYRTALHLNRAAPKNTLYFGALVTTASSVPIWNYVHIVFGEYLSCH